MSDPTCADRIAKHLKSREEDIGTLLARINDPDDLNEDDAQEELDSYPLEISTSVTFKVLISTGGPADYLTCEIESREIGGGMHTHWKDYGPQREFNFVKAWERTSDVIYHFADWFDHASTTLPDDSPLVTWVDQLVEYHQ